MRVLASPLRAPVRVHVRREGMHPFLRPGHVKLDTPREPLRWHAAAGAGGWVAYWALAARPEWQVCRAAAECRSEPGSSYDVSMAELTALWDIWYPPRQGGENLKVAKRFDEYHGFADDEKRMSALELPSREQRDARNACFDKLLADIGAEAYTKERRLDKSTDALVPYAPAAAMLPLNLKDGTQVWLRPMESADVRALAAFLCGLSREAYRSRFPNAGPNDATRSQLAAQLVQDLCAARESRGFVVQDAFGRILGLLDYTATPSRHTCEFDVVVADATRGKGLGALLMNELRQNARRDGYRGLRATVSRENASMLALLKRMGAGSGVASQGNVPGYLSHFIDISSHEERLREFVELVQLRLEARGWYRARRTGAVDETTRDALKAFQSANQLPPSGDLTRETLALLNIDEAQSREFEQGATPVSAAART